MSLRHLLAAPLLALHRLRGAPEGLRILLFHDTPARDLAALERLIRRLPPAAPDRVDGSGWLYSFDDGFASNLAAAEVLERHGARGLFFVCPGLMDIPPEAQPAAIAATIFDGKRHAPEGTRLMSWDEVKGLAARGHAIGSHTLTHRRLTTLSPEEAEAEIGGAAARLVAELGRPVPWFAYPFGDIDSICPEALAVVARHHQWCRSGVRGPNPPGTHPLGLFADHVDLEAPAAYQDLAAEGGLDSRYKEARLELVAMAKAAGPEEPTRAPRPPLPLRFTVRQSTRKGPTKGPTMAS